MEPNQQQVPSLPDVPEMPKHLAGLSEEPPRRLEDVQSQPQVPQEPASTPDQAQQEQGAPVPSHRLREERERREAAENQLRDLQDNQRRLTDRFTILQETIQSAQQKQLDSTREPTLPDPSEDLQGYVEAVKRQADERVGKIEEQFQEISQRTEYDQQVKAVYDRARADEQVFQSQAPDFRQAYAWLRNQQMADLTAMGVDPGLAAQEVDAKEIQLTSYIQQQGGNSAEAFYKAAVTRGWKPQQQGVVNTTQSPDPSTQSFQSSPDAQVTPIAQHPQYAHNQGQQVVQPQPAPHQQYQPHGQTLDNINEGMLHSRSLDEAPPGQSAVPMTLDHYANMSDAEFMAHADKVAHLMKSAMR